MPSTVIVRLNEMAASEGRNIGIQTNMVYSTERGLQKNVTYMRLTAEPLAVPPVEFTDEFAIGQLADNDIEFQTDAIVPQQESSSADKSANDIRDMDAQFINDHPSQRQIEISADDLDLGPIDDFQEPVQKFTDTLMRQYRLLHRDWVPTVNREVSWGNQSPQLVVHLWEGTY